MASYTKTAWVNNTTPAISAANLNKIEDQLETLTNGLFTPDGIDYTGASDSYTNLQAAINSAGPAGPGRVQLEPGTIAISQPLTLPDGVTLVGAGQYATRIVPATGWSGSALIKSDNFASLTGTDTWLVSAGMKHSFGLKDLWLDCNNIVGRAVQFYGKGYFVSEVLISNGTVGGFYSEGGNSGGQNQPADMPECIIGPLHIYGCVGYAFEYFGPHDGLVRELYVSGNQVAGSKGVLIDAGANSNGFCEIGNMHIYGMDSEGLNCTRAIKANRIIVESVDTDIVQLSGSEMMIGQLESFGSQIDNNETRVLITGSQNRIAALKIDESSSATGVTSLDIQGNENNIESAIISGSGSTNTGVKLTGRGHKVNLSITEYSGVGGVAYNHNPSANCRECDISLNLRGNRTAISASSTGSTRNRIYAAGYDNTTAVSGSFGAGDTATGAIVDGGGTVYLTNDIRQASAVDLTITTAQTVNVPHGLAYAPTIEKCQVMLAETTAAIAVDYLRIESVNATNVVVGVKLGTAAGAGTASLLVHAAV